MGIISSLMLRLFSAQDQKKTQVETLSQAVSNGIYTANEARAFLDKEARPGGDVLNRQWLDGAAYQCGRGLCRRWRHERVDCVARQTREGDPSRVYKIKICVCQLST